VVRHEERLDLVNEFAQSQQVVRVYPVDRSHGHGHAVQDDRVHFADLAENAARPSAVHHEVLRYHLDKIERHPTFKKLGIMLLAKAKAETVRR
jgi:hypothetical protein